MRELVFALEYGPGSNAVADTLADHADARIRSLSLHVTDERLWRVDHATGPPEALADIETTFRETDYYADCLATTDCGASQRTQVLDHSGETLVLYSCWERSSDCASVPHIARAYLGDGLLFDTNHEGRHYTWRIIHSGEGDATGFFDELEATVGGGVRMEMLRTAAADGPTGETTDGPDALSAEQEAALRAAVEHGYYETPREIDVSELADHLGVPRSTLTYRLRRAEAYLAEQHVADERLPASTPG
ncbi:transcriptional regulator [Halobacteriales archaeon QS_4_69_225]|nr:MAG: transcriptional regulator [Halobacteriales archaeon QS_4_69_225]